MSTVKRKVSILADTGSMSGRQSSAGTLQARALGVSDSAPCTPTAARGSSPKKDREGAALKLWHQWAQQTLGPITSDPTADDYAEKARSIKKLERDCAALTARAQQRLELSAALYGSSQSLAGGASAAQQQHATSLRGPSHKEAAWASREKRRFNAYQAVSAAGTAERQLKADSGWQQQQRPSTAPVLKSRDMLDMLMDTALDEATDSPQLHIGGNGRTVGSGTLARPGQQQPEQHSRMPALAAAASIGAAVAAITTPQRPQSAAPALAHRAPGAQASTRGVAAAGVSSSAAVAAATLAAAADMRAQTEALHQQLDAAQTQLEAQGELEVQLRETVDLLRARLHCQTQREVDNQRRLQQHMRLEPLFDRLAEVFTFKTPEEVVDRLEFLEDDKLGTIDQMVRAQEEVAALQQRLNAAVKAADTARTTAATEHIQSSARLQAQNEALELELELQAGLVRRLQERQDQLATLQSAVLDLWGRCQADPAFLRANQLETGSAGLVAGRAGGAAAAADKTAAAPVLQLDAAGSPLAILSSVREFVVAKSPNLARQHYMELQRVANRVWQHHFQHKEDIRGRVVETFEQLSSLADTMASSVRTGQEQLSRSKSNERYLAEQVKRLAVGKRALEAQLRHREQYLRDVAGVPRASRRANEACTPGESLGSSPGTTRSSSPTFRRPQSARSVHRSSSNESPSTHGHHGATARSGPLCRSHVGAILGAATDAGHARPHSAPHGRSRLASSGGVSASPGPCGGGTLERPTTTACILGTHGDGADSGSGSAAVLTAAAELSDGMSAAVGHQHAPFTAVASPTLAKSLGGALHFTGRTAAAPPVSRGAAVSGSLAHAREWSPPQKGSIEAAFLSRLKRAA